MEFYSDIRRKEREAVIRLRGAGGRSRAGSSRGGFQIQPSAIHQLHFTRSKNNSNSSRSDSCHTEALPQAHFGASFYRCGNSSTCSNVSNSNDRSWLPGETIPTFVPDSPLATSTPMPSSNATENLIDMFHEFQSGIDVQLSSILSTLKEVAERISKLESQQSQLEKEVKESTLKGPTSASPLKPGKCRRDIPAPLQSKIRCVHASFDEDKQLDVSLPINSEFNAKVVDAIVEAIGTEKFDETLIHRGVAAHRKTLVAKGKLSISPVKKKKRQRSRQQRSYEQRSSVLKPGRESDLWKNVTPDMMSEEDDNGGSYTRHPPSYHSMAFNKFINKLDKRLSTKHLKHPRLERRLGSPRFKPVPDHCRKLMVAAVSGDNNAEDQAEEQASCNSSESEELISGTE